MANTPADNLRDESELMSRLQSLFEGAKAERRFGSKEAHHQIAWALTEELWDVMQTMGEVLERAAAERCAELARAA